MYAVLRLWRMSVDIGQDILDALSRGGVAALRSELAQFLNAAIVRLSRRGKAAQQLALIAEAAARSDEGLAGVMDSLNHQDRVVVARELADALTLPSGAPEDVAATEYLLDRARAVHAQLSLFGLIGGGVAAVVDRGAIAISHSGQGDVTIDARGPLMKPILIYETEEARLLCADPELAARIAIALLEQRGGGAAEGGARHRA